MFMTNVVQTPILLWGYYAKFGKSYVWTESCDIAINIKFPYGLILAEISLLYCNDSISCQRCSFTFGTSREGASEGNVQNKPSLIFIKKGQ